MSDHMTTITADELLERADASPWQLRRPRPEPRACAGCGEEFTPKRSDAKHAAPGVASG